MCLINERKSLFFVSCAFHLFLQAICNSPSANPTPPHTHAHTLHSKERKTSTLECKENDLMLKRSESEELKQKQKSSNIGKIRRQKRR